MIKLHYNPLSLPHRKTIHSAIKVVQEELPEQYIEIFVGTRQIIAATRTWNFWWTTKKNKARKILYFTGFGRLFTDFSIAGKLVFFMLIFACNCATRVEYIVENKADFDLLIRLTWRKVHQINGSGFFETFDSDNIQMLERKNAEIRAISYVSRFGKSKHTEQILSLAQSLPDNVKLRIAGEDIQGEHYKREFEKIAQNQENVEFYGYIVDREKLFSLIKSTDLFLYPSMREGCPFTVLESIHCGTLPIVCDTPGSKELAESIGTPYINVKHFSDYKKLEFEFKKYHDQNVEEKKKVYSVKKFSAKKVNQQFVKILLGNVDKLSATVKQ